MKYRKKPVEVEAMQLLDDGDKYNVDECVKFYGEAAYKTSESCSYSLVIKTLEGHVEVCDEDWIIKNVAVAGGEFYVCKPDIFEKTYEKVRD